MRVTPRLIAGAVASIGHLVHRCRKLAATENAGVLGEKAEDDPGNEMVELGASIACRSIRIVLQQLAY